jgi:hypothetical protein
MVPVGLSAMFEGARGAPPADDLSVVGGDPEPDTPAEMLAGTYANLPVPVVLLWMSHVGDNGHGADQGSSTNTTGPGLDAIGAVESGGEAIGLASWILAHPYRCSGNGVESPAFSAPCG